MQFHFRHGIPRSPQPRKKPIQRFCKDCDAVINHPAERCGRCNKIQDGISNWKHQMWLLYGDDWIKYSYLENSQELKKEFIKTSLK